MYKQYNLFCFAHKELLVKGTVTYGIILLKFRVAIRLIKTKKKIQPGFLFTKLIKTIYKSTN